MQQWQLSHKIFAFYTFCNPSEKWHFLIIFRILLQKEDLLKNKHFLKPFQDIFIKAEHLNPTAR